MIECANCGVAQGIGIIIGFSIYLLFDLYCAWREGRKILRGK